MFVNVCLLLWRVRLPKIHRKLIFVVRKVRKEKGVELLQTTRCFDENDTLFWWKRHVVLLKTTRCFIENDTLFLEHKGTNWALIFRPLWHLWQQKSKIAVGCACVYARVASPLGAHPQIRKLGNFLCGQNPHRRAKNVKCLRQIFIWVYPVLLSLICKIGGCFSEKCILSRIFHSLRLYLPIYK